MDLACRRRGRSRYRQAQAADQGRVKTKRECQAALNDVLAALRAGTFVESSKRTVEWFLVDEWLPALRHLRPSTLSNYRTHIRTCVLPTLGPIPLQQLSPAHLNASYEALLSRGRLRDGHGIAITMDTYSHVIPGLDEQAAETVARLILGMASPVATSSLTNRWQAARVPTDVERR